MPEQNQIPAPPAGFSAPVVYSQTPDSTSNASSNTDAAGATVPAPPPGFSAPVVYDKPSTPATPDFKFWAEVYTKQAMERAAHILDLIDQKWPTISESPETRPLSRG
jgi:hypothetical protein